MKFTVPNQLTILRIALTPVFLYYFLQGTPREQLISTGVFALASLTDWYDGWYARRFGVITSWGQFMDPLADKLLVSSALIVFSTMHYVKGWMVAIIVARDVMVTIIRSYALWRGRPIVTHIIAKWKTFLQMVTIAMILIYVNYLNYFGEGSSTYQMRYTDAIGISMSIVTLLTVISAIIYIRENYRLIIQMLREFFISPFRG